MGQSEGVLCHGDLCLSVSGRKNGKARKNFQKIVAKKLSFLDVIVAKKIAVMLFQCVLRNARVNTGGKTRGYASGKYKG